MYGTVKTATSGSERGKKHLPGPNVRRVVFDECRYSGVTMTKYRLNKYEEPLDDLQNDNRKPEVKAEWAIPSSSRQDMAHVVRKVECLTKPFKDADVVEDRITLFVCTCEDFQYNQWNNTVPELESFTGCKHCRVLKHEKAKEDQNQSELPNTPVGDK